MRNQVTLIGNMGDIPQITNFENGGKVARFNLATSAPSMKGEKTAEWHRLFAFGNLAQFIENFGGKGKRIAITGRLVNRTYLSKDGQPRKISEVEIRNIIGL
ncbi:MAG: single-stranded DNA-binding protein [Crocinitomicaceae bacterium]|nr:single-stranded DNA-binding protein [Crocinitomicaceae bacterium]